jgi:cysteinyl-tRNA synthetase
MRKWILYLIIAYIIASIMTGCNSSTNLIGNSIFGGGSGEGEINIDYRKEMRKFVKGISSYAKNFNQNFIVITQNGQELLTENGEPSGEIVFDYVNSIDGIGREELFYGYEGDDIPTPDSIRNWMILFLDIAKNNGKKVLVIDYSYTPSYVDDSYNKNAMKGYISFAADSRELNNIPSYPPSSYNVNSDDIILYHKQKTFYTLLILLLFLQKRISLMPLKIPIMTFLLLTLFIMESN